MALTDLVAEWRIAKEAENDAVFARRELESMIINLMPKKDEGSVTEATEEGKVTVTYKITRKVDTAELQANWAGLGRNTQNCFKWAADISTAAMRSVQELDNVAYLQAAKFITSTPAKPALTIKL
jgi:hypothetical protein